MKHDSDILKQIKNYFMRRRSASEAYEYEREIERDAFLYEAIEGMEEMHMSDLQQALDELEERVNRKASATVFDKVNWRVAAMIAVIVVAGTSFVILGLNTKNEPAVATDNETQEVKEYAPRTEELDFATISDSINLIESYIELEEPISNGLEGNAEMMAVQEEVVEQNVPTPTELQKPEALKDKTVEFKAAYKAADTSKSNNKSTADAVVFTDATTATNNDVTYNWTPVQEAELSVPSKEEGKRMAAPAIDSYTNAAPSAAATPSNGSSAYQQYIASNLKKTYDMKSGSVTVSFEFDKNGQPKKVSVVKSLCEACDQEAIRLIENGPAWNVEDKKKRVNYTITIP